MVRQDQMGQLEEQLARKTGNLGCGGPQHPNANGHVADEVAFNRVFGRERVRELVELADVVEDRASDEEVATSAVRVGEERGDLEDLEDVLEQPAPIVVV